MMPPHEPKTTVSRGFGWVWGEEGGERLDKVLAEVVALRGGLVESQSSDATVAWSKLSGLLPNTDKRVPLLRRLSRIRPHGAVRAAHPKPNPDKLQPPLPSCRPQEGRHLPPRVRPPQRRPILVPFLLTTVGGFTPRTPNYDGGGIFDPKDAINAFPARHCPHARVPQHINRGRPHPLHRRQLHACAARDS